MGEMGMPSEHITLRQRTDDYWHQSRQPLASLLFVAPLLVIYEVGVLAFGATPNGADAAMQWTFERLGVGQHLLPPALVVCTLLGWHYVVHQPWRLSGGILSAMIVESVLLAVVLRVICFLQGTLISLSLGERLNRAVGYLGAGIYEEYLFRLVLLWLVAWAFRHAGTPPGKSLIVSVAITSVLFAGAHYIGPHGDDLAVFSFTFRTLAGVFFAVLMIYRGFGVAAGSHAAFDLLVGLFP
jgi:hypothetical protein